MIQSSISAHKRISETWTINFILISSLGRKNIVSMWPEHKEAKSIFFLNLGAAARDDDNHFQKFAQTFQH